MKCRTDRIPRSAAPSDLFERSLSANLCVPRVHIHGSAQCAVEKTPTRSQLLTMLFFFFFFFLLKNETNLQVNLSVEFGSEKYAKKWEFGLRKF